MNKKDIDPANVQIRPVKEEGVDPIAGIDSLFFGALDREYYREKLGWGTKRAGIGTFLVAEARTSISQVDGRG